MTAILRESTFNIQDVTYYTVASTHLKRCHGAEYITEVDKMEKDR
jgi:hypothetical protein